MCVCVCDKSKQVQNTTTTTTTTSTHTIVLLLFWNLSGTTRMSRYQKGKTRKGKTYLDLLEQEIIGWQWHQQDHMQIICT